MLFLSLNLSIILLDSDQDSGTKHFDTMENFPSEDDEMFLVNYSLFADLTLT